MKKKNYNGGFSKGVYETPIFQDSCKGGYIGSSRREFQFDEILEKELRAVGLEDRGVATWLTSSSARHMMDSVDDETTLEQFTELVKPYTSKAFINVIVWSHPDFKGTVGSSLKISDTLHRYYKDKWLP